jgi:hypothetical protein
VSIQTAIIIVAVAPNTNPSRNMKRVLAVSRASTLGNGADGTERNPCGERGK